jgi:hypothetical protein
MKILLEDKDKTSLFKNNMSRAWKDIYALGDLEFKYPFFRIDIPNVSYVINKNIFKMLVNYRLALSAKKDDAYFMVDFQAPHNYMFLECIGRINTRTVEAQEGIGCDPKLGYQSVHKFFKDNGIIMNSNIDYRININDDTLIFDDHDSRHQVFRGWTGGYDPGYGGPDDISNVFPRKLKNGWDAAPYYISLEKRINTLKMLFDGINSYAKFDVDENIQPITKIPDFKSIYIDTIMSERYSFMESFGSEIADKLGINPEYDITITMHDTIPRIDFLDDKNGIFFYTDCIEFKDMKGFCELHIPRSKVKIKDFDRTYLQYNDGDYPEFNKRKRNMIGVYEYIPSLEDIPIGFKKCLERLAI